MLSTGAHVATTTRDDQTIAYRDHGGEGPPVVLLHSFLMDGRMFAPQVEALKDGYRVVTVDERGHGDTPADAPFDYWEVARDVLAVMDELAIDSAAVVGTSQGGFVGMRMALEAPERVDALIVMGTSAAAQDQEIGEQYRQLAAAWAGDGPPDEVIATVASICFGTPDAGEWGARWAAVPAETIDRTIDTLVTRDDIVDRLPEITCPTLVLHGSEDAAYPVEHARTIADEIPKAEPLVVAEGGAHFLSHTHPEEVTPRIRAFLDTHTG